MQQRIRREFVPTGSWLRTCAPRANDGNIQSDVAVESSSLPAGSTHNRTFRRTKRLTGRARIRGQPAVSDVVKGQISWVFLSPSDSAEHPKSNSGHYGRERSPPPLDRRRWANQISVSSTPVFCKQTGA
jgi:hypothetical protein